MLSIPPDNFLLAGSHENLGELIKTAGEHPFARRIPYAPRLLAVRHSCGSAVMASAYWRHKLVHFDLLFANAASSLMTEIPNGLPIKPEEMTRIATNPRPLLILYRP